MIFDVQGIKNPSANLRKMRPIKSNPAISILGRSWTTPLDSAQKYPQIFLIKEDKLLRFLLDKNGL